MNAQCFFLAAAPSGHAAPLSIHFRMRSILSGESAAPPIGIRGCPPAPVIRFTIRLPAESPGVMARIAASFVSSRRPPNWTFSPWHP